MGSTQAQLEPQPADTVFAESADDVVAHSDLTTDQDVVDEAAFDAAIEEFESDPLDSDLTTALM